MPIHNTHPFDPAEVSQPVRPLLPVPDQDDVTGFIALYLEKYGVEMDASQAHEILGGLMRFLYLTRLEAGMAPPRESGADSLGR